VLCHLPLANAFLLMFITSAFIATFDFGAMGFTFVTTFTFIHLQSSPLSLLLTVFGTGQTCEMHQVSLPLPLPLPLFLPHSASLSLSFLLLPLRLSPSPSLYLLSLSLPTPPSPSLLSLPSPSPLPPPLPSLSSLLSLYPLSLPSLSTLFLYPLSLPSFSPPISSIFLSLSLPFSPSPSLLSLLSLTHFTFLSHTFWVFS
jgi:hypothetical protein